MFWKIFYFYYLSNRKNVSTAVNISDFVVNFTPVFCGLSMLKLFKTGFRSYQNQSSIHCAVHILEIQSTYCLYQKNGLEFSS